MKIKTLYEIYLENRIKMEKDEFERVYKDDSIKAAIEIQPKIFMLESILKTYRDYKEMGEA